MRSEASAERVPDDAIGDDPPQDAQGARDDIDKVPGRLVEALRDELRRDPDFMALRTTTRTCGQALVDVLANLGRWSHTTTGLASPSNPEHRFVQWFVDEVAGDCGLIVDALARRAARRTAERLLESSAVRDAVASGDTSDVVLPDEVFCGLYRLFFADLIEELFRAVIFAKLATVTPVLALVDPARAAALVVTRALSPCAEQERDPSKTLTAIARDMADHIVERLLDPAEEAA